MRAGRRAVMSVPPPKKRVEWRAEDGIPISQAGWYYHSGNPETNGVWTVHSSGSPALKYSLTAAGQRYRFFLPETLREPAAITLDLAMEGINNAASAPTLSVFLPGETTTAFQGISPVLVIVSTTNNNNGSPTLVSTNVLCGTRQSVRLERRGEQALTFSNGAQTYSTTTVPNAKLTTFLSDFPAGAPKESGLILTIPPGNFPQHVWLFGIVWEEL